MASARRVRAVARELCGDHVGCSDGGCVFGHPGGMRTNGGCVCIKSTHPIDLRRTIRKLAAVALRLAEERGDG